MKPRPSRPFAAAALPLLLAAGAAAAAAPGDGSAVLVAGRGELRVAVAGEEAYRSSVAEGVEFRAVAPLEQDRWVAAGVRDGSALLLVRGEGGAAERLPVPEAGGGVVSAPVPLGAAGELVGLAWLAGDDPGRLAVRFARWDGGAWGEPEVVAPPARDSQLALSGAVLRDGSTVLVWSAFDGRDDEILWSRRAGNRWSAPARVAADNRVPDVTPAVAALGDGAVVAWSRYGRSEGEYRLVTAHWTGDGWSAPAPAGPAGSIHPALRSEGDGALLLYRDARRRGWTLLRLDAGGRVAARAFLDHPSPQGEPALLASDAESVRVLPPGGGEARRLRWEAVP